MPKKTIIATYWTLKRSERNHYLLSSATYLKKSFLPFIKITGTSFPKITFPFNEIVSNYIEVELYEVNDEELRDLDRLEWHPGWYERIKMTTTSWEECEVYHMPIEQNEWTDNREEYLLTQPLEEISMYSWFSN